MTTWSAGARAVRALGVLLVVGAAPVAGQAQGPDGHVHWFPRRRLFPAAVADPAEPRFAGGFIRTDLLAQKPRERPDFLLDPEIQSGGEVMALVHVGGAFSLLQLDAGTGRVGIGLELGDAVRFRIERDSRDELATDWVVALPIEGAWGPWAARFRLIHRSSHLGDEFLLNNSARRIEIGGDGVDLYASRRLGPLRAYAGGEWVFYSEIDRSELPGVRERDHAQAQAGLEGEWRPWRAGSPWRLVGGVDWQAASRTRWRGQTALAAGIRLAGADRSITLLARAFHGASTAGEFFLTPETFYGVELEVRP